MSGRAEGLAWEAVHSEGDAAIPEGYNELTNEERYAFQDELEEWVSKARYQPELFADRGARAARLIELIDLPR
jgi:hypothetical protein